jgi:hypothetical protein
MSLLFLPTKVKIMVKWQIQHIHIMILITMMTMIMNRHEQSMIKLALSMVPSSMRQKTIHLKPWKMMTWVAVQEMNLVKDPVLSLQQMMNVTLACFIHLTVMKLMGTPRLFNLH